MVKIIVFQRGWVILSTNLRGMGRRPPTAVGIITWRCLRDPRFSNLNRTPDLCQTDGHTMTASTVLAQRPAGKN